MSEPDEEPDEGLDYWSVDFPGMSRKSAEELVQVAGRLGIAADGIVVDPAHFFTAHMDRETVRAIYRGLSGSEFSKSADGRSDAIAVGGFCEILEEWLRKTSD
jgi:hypothetical protein